MWPSRVVSVGCAVLLSLVVFGGAAAEETSGCSPKSCQNPDNQKAVCGSDGLSYPNRCQLERLRCKNQNVTMLKRGMCKTQKPCVAWDLLSSDASQHSFKPRCKTNGDYEPGQCQPETGYCWCVTPDGLPIPYTLKKMNDKPGAKPIRCGSRKKKTRSPSSSAKKNICKITEKSTFNSNLITSFHSEFRRETERNDKDEVVIKWKFRTLDQNNDESLDRNEYKDIKRLVKKAMKPKKCAKAFPKSCDINNDGKISLQEWSDCFDRSGQSDGKQSSSSDGDEDEEEEDIFSKHQPPSIRVLKAEQFSPVYDEESTENREDEVSGCLADRKLALDEAKDSGHPSNYLPECTPDGRYKKVQCYIGYCFCVNEDTGTTISGTSVNNSIPNCNLLKVTQQPMKGCPDDKKLKFLKDLTQFLQTKMTESSVANNLAGSPLSALKQSKEEQVAHWSFNYLDKDKSKILEKAEWKAFKEFVAPIKGLRKCGKKLPRYCDIDKDRGISRTEWLNCLNVQEQQSVFYVSPRAGKKNPLDVLKDD